MPFDPFSLHLPVTDIIPEVRAHLAAQNTLIVNAPAGKSTLLPLALLEEAWLGGQKIIMLAPRRLAARTITERLAQLLGEEVGRIVGYRIRFAVVSDLKSFWREEDRALKPVLQETFPGVVWR